MSPPAVHRRRSPISFACLRVIEKESGSFPPFFWVGSLTFWVKRRERGAAMTDGEEGERKAASCAGPVLAIWCQITIKC